MSGPEESPDFLSRTPKRGAGVRRLNRWPLVIATLLVCLILGAVTYTYQMRLNEMRRQAEEENLSPEPASSQALLKDAPEAGFIPAKGPAEPARPPAEPAVLPPAPAAPPADSAWDEFREQQKRLQAARDQAALQAITASTPVAVSLRTPPAPPAAEPAAGSANAAAALLAGRSGVSLPGFAGFDAAGRPIIDAAAAKRDFLKDGQAAPAGRQLPLSRFEVKAGTVIPAVMIGGINSDLPGQILAQVAENVYDSASGRFVIIPQGAKLIGTYDNAVAHGQNRVLVAWTRIIYPDGSSLELGRMPGADEGGYAGFSDKTDNHTLRLFGDALLMSVFSAGVQLSQGTGSSQTSPTAQQTLSASLGQELGQVASEMIRRNMQIQPTLEIRPGYRFNVIVTRDLSAAPWTPPQSLSFGAARAG